MFYRVGDGWFLFWETGKMHQKFLISCGFKCVFFFTRMRCTCFSLRGENLRVSVGLLPSALWCLTSYWREKLIEVWLAIEHRIPLNCLTTVRLWESQPEVEIDVREFLPLQVWRIVVREHLAAPLFGAQWIADSWIATLGRSAIQDGWWVQVNKWTMAQLSNFWLVIYSTFW